MDYANIKKKYSLPELDALKKEFSIGKIDDEEPVLDAIRKRIDDKIDTFLRILNRMLQPDTLISDMNECKEFDDDDKKSMFELYKRLMIIHNDSLLCEAESDEKTEAEFISGVMKEWPAIKKEMKNIIIKMKDSWKKEVSDLKEDVGYVG